MEKKIAINLNFDSLNEVFGFPEGYHDPSFFKVFDRIAELCAQYNAKLSIYVIGKDLEDPEVFARVREWSQAGHEIGNHTWSHPMNLGALPKEALKAEIMKAHEVITRCIGHPPKGFIAPAWSSSSGVVATLIELDYTYDTSVFPSIFLFPMVMKIALNHRNDLQKMKRVLHRRDWLIPFTKPVVPFLVDAHFRRVKSVSKKSLLILPLPTLSRLLPPYWHTLGFLFGWDFAKTYLDRLLKRNNYFYYLVHPSDFIGIEDVAIKAHHPLERMHFTVKEKLERLQELFNLMFRGQCTAITMGQLADEIRQQLIKNFNISS